MIEELKQTIIILAELGFSPLNIVLIGMVYFMGAQHGMFPKFWRTSDENKGVNIGDLHTEMMQLREHFNHETSDSLTSIKNNTLEIREDVKTLQRKHDEYDRFGIKIRSNAN